jgi:hypothetical protein
MVSPLSINEALTQRAGEAVVPVAACALPPHYREAGSSRKGGRVKPKKKKAKPSPGKCKTCSGYGWITSGVGHFGEQEGGHKGVMARCEHCLGLGFIEIGER